MLRVLAREGSPQRLENSHEAEVERICGSKIGNSGTTIFR